MSDVCVSCLFHPLFGKLHILISLRKLNFLGREEAVVGKSACELIRIR